MTQVKSKSKSNAFFRVAGYSNPAAVARILNQDMDRRAESWLVRAWEPPVGKQRQRRVDVMGCAIVGRRGTAR